MQQCTQHEGESARAGQNCMTTGGQWESVGDGGTSIRKDEGKSRISSLVKMVGLCRRTGKDQETLRCACATRVLRRRPKLQSASQEAGWMRSRDASHTRRRLGILEV